jgi:hypothetical protein
LLGEITATNTRATKTFRMFGGMEMMREITFLFKLLVVQRVNYRTNATLKTKYFYRMR